MNNMIDLTARIPQYASFAKQTRRRERLEKLAIGLESLATFVIAGSFLLLVAAFLSTL